LRRHDCGVIVLKFIELWDGSPKFNGNCMPQYTTVRNYKFGYMDVHFICNLT